jgi:cytochrome c oxidase assembly protein subunit 15
MTQSIVLNAGAARSEQPASKQVAIWLLACCALVFAMVMVGGITRLTHSGLSMVEWQPIVGTIPPLDQAQWQDVFEKYQRTPEYQKVNHGMSLDEFKGIFWWEYFHRLLGRAIGIVFFLPLLYFIIRSRIDRPLAWRLLVIFVLGGLQGALGWYMVKSGLVDDPRVSQYRLTAHLGMAFLIYAAMLWTALGLLSSQRAPTDPRRRRLGRYAIALSVLIFVMALSGGLVAGIHAGRAYNTFPLMNGHLVPPEYFMLQPWYENFFSNMAAVQFDHRLIAWLLFFAIPLFWMRTRGLSLRPRARLACNLLPVALGVQIALGISTLLLVVPLPLAAAHQAGALVLFSVAIWTASELR